MTQLTHIERLQRQRAKLLLTDDPKFVFFASLLQIEDKLDTEVKSACTDGTVIRWNPTFIDEQNDKQLFGTMLHELMHIALLHPTVAANFEDKDRMQVAADLAVNSILQDMGVKLPEGIVMPGEGQFSHLEKLQSLEQYYHLLSEMDDEDIPKDQPGEFEQAGSEAQRQAGEGQAPAMSQELASEIVKAMVGNALKACENVGNMPGSLRQGIQAAIEPKVDFKTILKRYRTKVVRGGADWTRLNRRLQAAGANVARNRRRKCNNVLILWDCSGSMSEKQASQCIAETLEVFGEVAGSVHLWQHDVDVVHKDELRQGQPLPVIERKTDGGTSHVELFNRIEESGLKVDVVVCLTDCQTSYPDDAPCYDTVWVSHVAVKDRNVPPFGELLVV